jgi:hypothetical protein
VLPSHTRRARAPLKGRVRQVWAQPGAQAEALFAAHVRSGGSAAALPGARGGAGLAGAYCAHARPAGVAAGLLPPPAAPRKARAANKALQALVAAVGESTVLYARAAAALGAAMEEDPPCLALCSLRAQLPLACAEAPGGGPRHLADADPALALAAAVAAAAKEAARDRAAVPALSPVRAAAAGVPPLPLAMLLRAPDAAGLLADATLRALRQAPPPLPY